MHQYLDGDGSGNNDGIVSADIGWQRLTNFTAWARDNNVKGFLGEYAVPGNTIGGTGLGGAALTNMLTYISTNSDVWLGWSYWGGGPWWGNTPTFPIEPSNIGQPSQKDQLAMSIIKHFFRFRARFCKSRMRINFNSSRRRVSYISLNFRPTWQLGTAMVPPLLVVFKQ